MARGFRSRERLLATAERLFYEFGIGDVGVDRICAEAVVGKMTLYRHFPSKDDLVLAYLARRDRYWRAEFARAVEAATGGPRDGIARLFERLATWFDSPEFFGCAFLNADAERVEARATALVREHKAMMRDLICNQIRALGVTPPELLAEQIFMLAEGAIVSKRLTDAQAPACNARTAALALLDAATDADKHSSDGHGP